MISAVLKKKFCAYVGRDVNRVLRGGVVYTFTEYPLTPHHTGVYFYMFFMSVKRSKKKKNTSAQ